MDEVWAAHEPARLRLRAGPVNLINEKAANGTRHPDITGFPRVWDVC